ncbi:MAG: hypothetical protein ACRD47_03330 [Nitrososphaeraceae archaeon]
MRSIGQFSLNKLLLVAASLSLTGWSCLMLAQLSLAQTPFTVYYNPDYDIQIDYPNDWTVKHDNLPRYQVVRFSAPEIEEQETSLRTIIYIPATVAVAVQPLDSANMTTDQFIDQFLDSTYTSPSEFRILETSNTTFAGIDSSKITMYEYVNNGNSKVIRVIGTQNGTAYMIKYAAAPGQYDEYLPVAERMINSFAISSVQDVDEFSQISSPSLGSINATSSVSSEPAQQPLLIQNQSSPFLLQPKSEEQSLVELPDRIIVTDEVLGDSRLPARANVISGQLQELNSQGETKGELSRFYSPVRFHFDDPSQIGLLGISHLLLGPIKSYDTPNDILEESRYYTNVPLNEQVVVELDQPGLNYFIASVQFANNTMGVYSNIMDNKGFTKSSDEDFLDFKIDEGNDYIILDDSDIDNIQSDPLFQQIASNIICSDLAEYGFPVCQQPTATTPSVNQPMLPQGVDSIFDDEDTSDDNDNDNDDNEDNDDNN